MTIGLQEFFATKLNLYYLFLLLQILIFNVSFIFSSLSIGAIIPINNLNDSNTNTDIELVFKHAIYISNQYKLTFYNMPATYPTLLHKLIKLTKTDRLKSMDKICKETNGNMLGFIGPYENKLENFIESLSQELDLIHIETQPTQQTRHSFNMYPSLDHLCNAFADLITLFQWKHAAIFYNMETNMKSITCLLSGPAKSLPKLDIVLKLTNPGDNYRVLLKDLLKRKIKNIIIDLPPHETQVLLRMCLQLGMINPEFQYVLTTLDVETIDLEDFKYNRANITAFRLIKSKSSFFKDIAVNLTDYYSINGNHEKNKIFFKTENALLFDAVFTLSYAVKEAEKSLDFRRGNVSCTESKPLKYGASLCNYLEKTTITGLTGHIAFDNRQRTEFELDVLQLRESGLIETGTWSHKNGLNFTALEEVYENIVSSKKIMRVATVIEEPYVMEKPDGEFEGFCIDVLKEIAQRMNFKYEIYKTPDNRYGTELANGSWDGMVRELIEKRADLAVSSLTISYKRQQVVDFTKPFISLGISILFKMPTSEKPGLFSFLNPLSLEIWIYTLTAYLAVSFILMVLARFSPYEWRNPHPCNKESEYLENTFNLSNSLWFAVGTLMQQGSDINPKAFSTRLVGGVWWFFTLIIISSYTANLAAFLTVERVVLPIQNVEDLANQNAIQYGTLNGGATMSFFKESSFEIYKKMWKVMESNSNNFVQSTEEGIDRVLKKNYAFFMESTMIDYNVHKNCNLTQIGGLLDSKGYGIATQRGSPYTEEISLKLLEMQEKGIIQQLYNRWWKAGASCMRDEKKDSKAHPLGVQNVGGIFVVLIGGLIFAIIVSVFEFSYFAKHNSERFKKSLCSEMVNELKFAIRCGGSTKKQAYTPANKQDLIKCDSINLTPIPFNYDTTSNKQNKIICNHEPESHEYGNNCNSSSNYNYNSNNNVNIDNSISNLNKNVDNINIVYKKPELILIENGSKRNATSLAATTALTSNSKAANMYDMNVNDHLMMNKKTTKKIKFTGNSKDSNNFAGKKLSNNKSSTNKTNKNAEISYNNDSRRSTIIDEIQFMNLVKYDPYNDNNSRNKNNNQEFNNKNNSRKIITNNEIYYHHN